MHYWYNTSGSAQNYNNTAYWFTDSGHTTNASAKPTSTDDVQIDSGDLTINSTNSCRNFVVSAGYTGTVTKSSTLYVYGSIFTLVSTMSIILNNDIVFYYTGTVLVTSAGKNLGYIILSSGSGTNPNLSLQDALTFYTIKINKGSITTNDYTLSGQYIWVQATNGTTFNLGSSTITLSITGFASISISDKTKASTTVNAGTSTIIMTGASPQFYGGDKTWYDVTFASSSTGTKYIYQANTFHTLRVTGSANKTDAVNLVDNQTADVYAFNGNSDVNRLLVYSNTFGTARTLNGNIGGTTTFASTSSNIDLRDITAGTYASGETDLSAITGNSGDCGGNTGFTFTTGATMYWHVDTGSTSDATKWFIATDGGGGAGRVPLPQDTGKWDANSFDSNGKTITQDMPRIGAIDFADTDNTYAFNPTVDTEYYGDYDVTNNTGNNNKMARFYARKNITIYSNGKTFGSSVYIRTIGYTVTLLGSMLCGDRIYVYTTFDLSGYNLGFGTLINSSALIIAGNSVISISSGSASQGWEYSGTATFTCNTSTIQFTGNSGADKALFGGNGLTYYNLSFPNGAGSPYRSVTISGSNTFNSISVGYGNAIYVTAGETQTFGSISLTGSATYGSLWTSLTSAVHYLLDTSGNNTATYTTISYSNASGGATFDASDGTNTDGGNNTGWIWAIGGNIKSWNGVALVNIKSINGVPIANVKEINGVTI